MYRIQCTEETFTQFIRIIEDGSLIIKLALTYPAVHEGTLKITFKYMNGDTTIIVPPLDLLNEGTNSDMMQTEELGMYYDSEDKRNKVYFTDKNATVRLDFSEKTPKIIKEVPASTLKYIGKFCLQIKVAYEWHANKGGIYFERQDKIIDHYSPEYKKCGDFEWQRLRNSSRSKLHFDSDLDDTMQIEVNKSRINSRNIDQSILKTVEYLVEKHCKDMYKKDPLVIKKKKDAAEQKRLKKKGGKIRDAPTNTGHVPTNTGHVPTNTGHVSTNTGHVPTNTGHVSTNTGHVSAPILKFKGNTLSKDNLLDWVRANKDDVEALSKLETLLL
jgi:hypothetical protein